MTSEDWCTPASAVLPCRLRRICEDRKYLRGYVSVTVLFMCQTSKMFIISPSLAGLVAAGAAAASGVMLGEPTLKLVIGSIAFGVVIGCECKILNRMIKHKDEEKIKKEEKEESKLKEYSTFLGQSKIYGVEDIIAMHAAHADLKPGTEQYALFWITASSRQSQPEMYIPLDYYQVLHVK